MDYLIVYTLVDASINFIVCHNKEELKEELKNLIDAEIIKEVILLEFYNRNLKIKSMEVMKRR